MRLIDADSINDFHIDFSSYKEGPDEDDVKAWLDKQPSIEAEPVRHGKWIKKKHKIFGNTYDYVCSSCGCDYALAEYAYCPNCGAKMDGKETDDR